MYEKWIWFTNIKFVGPVWQKKLLHHFKGDLDAIFHASRVELQEVEGVNDRVIEQIIQSRNLDHAKKRLEAVQKKGMGLLTFTDERYPLDAKCCPESPVLLYFIGKLQSIESAVAVVGTRRCTNYGRGVAEELGTKLAESGVPLVSGFAKGIDTYAQVACMKAGGYTIGFLGNGVDICYPKEQQKVYDQFIESGSVFLSKYPPGTAPKPAHFIERNSLISAWSTEVVVVEAGEKSGALWTANFARKQGKRLLVVPHSIYSREAIGSNKLLLETEVQPLLSVNSLESINKEQDQVNIGMDIAKDDSGLEYGILADISLFPCSVDELHEKFRGRLSRSEIEQQLFELELEGKITIRGVWVHLIN